MALINQNSIIGVTSITSPSASNVLTVHTNDTTERLRVSTSGVSFSGTSASLDTSGNLTVSGNVSIGGTLTYEDVTNIDAVGIITANSGIYLDDSISHIGDTNTKIRFPAADTVSIETAGSERLRVDSSGRLLIGRTTQLASSAERLTIDSGMAIFRRNSANAGALYIRNEDTTADTRQPYLIFTDGAGNRGGFGVQYNESSLWISGQNGIAFRTGGSAPSTAERLRITSTGQLLLGINNAVDAEVDLQIHSATSGNGPILNMTNDTGDCRIFFGQDNSSGSANAQGQIRYNVANNYLAAYAAGAERLRITSGGDVTIGNSSVAFPSGGGLQVYNASAPRIKLTNSTTGVASGDGFQIYVSGSGAFLDQKENAEMRFYTNAAERLRIDADGRLLLGLNSSIGGNAIFQVQGSGNRKAHFHQPDTGGCLVQFTNTTTGTTTTNGLEIGLGGDEQGQIWNYYNSYFRIATNNTERLRITSGGDVCVGGHSSNYANSPLEVRGTNAGGDVAIRVTNNSTASGTQAGIIFTTTTADYTTAGIGYERGTDDALKFYVGQSAGGGGFTNAYEKLRINDKAELIQKSATNSTNSWYSLNSNNTVTVTNGDNDIYIERVGGSNGYDQLVYKKTPMTDNCDISFRLSGSQPGGQWRHIGITICGDGGSDFSNMDRLVIRQQGSTGGSNNRIRVDKAGGGTTADVTSGSIPSFFDGTERNVLIQIRGNIIHVLSDNVLVFSEQMDAALHDVSGFFGIGIYETSGNIRLRNFQLTNYGALGVPQKRPCLQTNMSSTYGSHGSLTTNTASTGILQASAYVDLCGNYTTSGSNAYTFVCPVDGVYAVNAHISMGGGNYSRHIWVMSYTLGGGNLPLGTYTEVLDLHPDTHSNHSYYNLWKFTKGTRVGMGINGNSGSLSGRNFQWGIMLVS